MLTCTCLLAHAQSTCLLAGDEHQDAQSTSFLSSGSLLSRLKAAANRLQGEHWPGYDLNSEAKALASARICRSFGRLHACPPTPQAA